MIFLIPVVTLLVGLVGGWFIHARLTLPYKGMWKQAVGQLEDQSLWGGGDQVAPPRLTHIPLTPPPNNNIRYVPGEWVMHETFVQNDAIYQAVRMGFDPVELGRTGNYRRFGALYRRDREQAQEAVAEMNHKSP